MRVCIVLLVFIFSGCSTLFVPQELSENYAREDGVDCNAFEAVDGNPNTVSNETRIVISLPEKKNIMKIVIYSPNISNFILYEFMGNEGDWRIIKSVKGNNQSKIVINTHVSTDKIRIFVTDTSKVRFADPGQVRYGDGNINIFSAQVDALPDIQEIELYGLINKKSKSSEPLF